MSGWTQEAIVQDSIAQDSIIPPRKIVIGAKDSPPFLLKEGGSDYSGISYDLWEIISRKLNIEYEIKYMSLSEMLLALEKGEIDFSINPITVTSKRIKRFDFTQPFYASNSAIATQVREEKGIWTYVKGFFSLGFLQVILLLVVVIFIFGFAAWFFERNKNDEFENNFKGLWSGIWWSAVTMTTVGYGDKSPQTFAGRFIALIWMFTAVIIISSFTASISSALTVDQLDRGVDNLNDLKELRVGTIASSASENFLRTNKIQAKGYETVQAGLDALEKKKLDAFVYDEPILKYYLEKLDMRTLTVSPFKFDPQYYGFSAPKGSDLIPLINPVLLEEIQSANWKAILSVYDLSDF